MEELVFTKIYDKFEGRIITEEHIVNDEKDIPVSAAWDTGSTFSCISPEFAKQLNLQPLCDDKLHTPYGIIQSKLYDVDILLNKQAIYTVRVAENPNMHRENVDLLIGMDIISEGDFVISTYEDITSFSFRIPSKGLIDFTKE